MGKQIKEKIKGTNTIDVQDLDQLKPGTGVDGYEYGADLSTEGVPLIDPGTGKTIAIRTFTYKMNPKIMRHTPDKQAIFNAHAQEITRFLWGDGLRPYEEVSPRVIIDSKRGVYQIFVACEARLNVMFADRPQNLSQLMANSKKPKP